MPRQSVPRVQRMPTMSSAVLRPDVGESDAHGARFVVPWRLGDARDSGSDWATGAAAPEFWKLRVVWADDARLFQFMVRYPAGARCRIMRYKSQIPYHLQVRLILWIQKLCTLMGVHQYLETSFPMSPILITAQLNLRYNVWSNAYALLFLCVPQAQLFALCSLPVSSMCCNILLRFWIWRRCEETIYRRAAGQVVCW